MTELVRADAFRFGERHAASRLWIGVRGEDASGRIQGDMWMCRVAVGVRRHRGLRRYGRQNDQEETDEFWLAGSVAECEDNCRQNELI